jgi:hypothetical protein
MRWIYPYVVRERTDNVDLFRTKNVRPWVRRTYGYDMRRKDCSCWKPLWIDSRVALEYMTLRRQTVLHGPSQQSSALLKRWNIQCYHEHGHGFHDTQDGKKMNTTLYFVLESGTMRRRVESCLVLGSRKNQRHLVIRDLRRCGLLFLRFLQNLATFLPSILCCDASSLYKTKSQNVRFCLYYSSYWHFSYAWRKSWHFHGLKAVSRRHSFKGIRIPAHRSRYARGTWWLAMLSREAIADTIITGTEYGHTEIKNERACHRCAQSSYIEIPYLLRRHVHGRAASPTRSLSASIFALRF